MSPTKEDFLEVIGKEVQIYFGPISLIGKVIDCDDTHLKILSKLKEEQILLSAIISFQEIKDI